MRSVSNGAAITSWLGYNITAHPPRCVDFAQVIHGYSGANCICHRAIQISTARIRQLKRMPHTHYSYDHARERFLQTDPVGYGAGDLNLYAYVRSDPLNRTDPSGLAGCSSNVPAKHCQTYMNWQRRSLNAVRATRAQLRQLRQERAEVRRGDREQLSETATATEDALEESFGSSSNSTIRTIERNLGRLQRFFEDPGAAAGGRYDIRTGSAAEIRGRTIGTGGYWNPASPNTIAIYVPGFNRLAADVYRDQTFVHEPLHALGLGNAPGFPERSFYVASGVQQWGTSWALENPGSYACLVWSGC